MTVAPTAPPSATFKVDCSACDWNVTSNEVGTGAWRLDRMFLAHVAACHPGHLDLFTAPLRRTARVNVAGGVL